MGLFKHLLPSSRRAGTGIEVRVVAHGQAIKNAQNGDGDVVPFVHDKPSEEKFVAEAGTRSAST